MNTSNITNYKPKDFAELLGVSVKTLQRWDREGTLKANRTPTDRRYYTYDQYLQFKGINIENDQRQAVIFSRWEREVSTVYFFPSSQEHVVFIRTRSDLVRLTIWRETIYSMHTLFEDM